MLWPGPYRLACATCAQAELRALQAKFETQAQHQPKSDQRDEHRIPGIVDLVHFGKLESRFGGQVAVEHLGDNTTGSADDGDDETVKIFLDRLPAYVERLAFAVNIVSAATVGLGCDSDGRCCEQYDSGGVFSDVQKAHVALMAEEQGREVHLARYPARARPSFRHSRLASR